ncbi:MAG: DUF58 domain-containing protein [Spirochaetes bacterium]|nr:DUF58 domain-containing protein [Spirochaetota bacterium]
MREFFRSVFFTERLYASLICASVLFVTGFFFYFVFVIAKIFTFFIILFFLMDALLLYIPRQNMKARRLAPDRLSNGDDNSVIINLENLYPFSLSLTIIDEIPFQFRKRDFSLRTEIRRNEKKSVSYTLHPVERGEYYFGALNIFAATVIGCLKRRFRFAVDEAVPVYPSIIQMKKYGLLAVSNRLADAGIRKIRRLGHTMEFDHIRRYVSGDDYRTINWKATARKTDIMVNQYEDEKSQPVYSIIDMSRIMKMPFRGMSLLDYAINSSLILSGIALYKQDKFGLIAYSDTVPMLLPADRKQSQMQKVLEALYKLKTDFKEPDYEHLYSILSRKLNQRSLIFLFTNFETLSSFKRNINFFRRVGRRHTLVVVFFKNTELEALIRSVPATTEEIYTKTIAEKFDFEKRQIVKELNKNAAIALLTAPDELTADTINTYLEIKARGML